CCFARSCSLFKQKTAYELETWLEFSRALFRSTCGTHGDLRAGLGGRGRQQLPDLRRHGRPGTGRAAPEEPGAGPPRLQTSSLARSEERRVGKGRKSRCAPDSPR